MIGTAHSSPSFRVVTDWYAATKPTQAFRVDPPVAMRDRFQCDVVDARQTRRWAVQQTWQLPAVASRQMFSGGADLLFDQIKVVEQPFSGGRDTTVGGHCFSKQGAHAEQDVFIFIQPGKKVG